MLLAPPLFCRNFGCVPVASDRACWRQPAHLSPWYYFRRIPTYVGTVPVPEVRHIQTDRQTDAILWQYRAVRSIAREKEIIIIMNSNSWYVGLHIMNCGLSSNAAFQFFHTRVRKQGKSRLLWPSSDPTRIYTHFGGVPVAPDRLCSMGVCLLLLTQLFLKVKRSESGSARRKRILTWNSHSRSF